MTALLILAKLCVSAPPMALPDTSTVEVQAIGSRYEARSGCWEHALRVVEPGGIWAGAVRECPGVATVFVLE